jgi:SAM-dependent methyltransferase
MNDVSKINAWQYYWSQKGQTAANTATETEALPLGEFWAGLSTRAGSATSILELGCGDKILFPMNQPSSQKLHIALDVSLSALQNNTAGISRICASGSQSLPIRPSSMDLIASQFGVEYFGLNALLDLTRYLRPSGAMALVCHHRGSVIYKNYLNHREALAALRQQNFWELLSQKLNRQTYDFSDEVRFLGLILKSFGEASCGGLILLIKDQLSQFEPTANDAVLLKTWIKDVHLATQSYTDLVESMITSALTKSQIDEIESLWTRRGFEVNISNIQTGMESVATGIIAQKAS